MIVIYGKWKVWTWLSDLLTYLQIDHTIMDDADSNDEILSCAEYIVASPWIKPSHMVYAFYKNKVLSELNYLWLLLPGLELPNIQYVGITWTNGKSTASWVMYQLLQKLFPEKKIRLTGNFDVPLSKTILSILQQDASVDHICVVETSSFMLYNLSNFIFDYALWLNIARDHLDWHGTMKEYTWAKLNICTYARRFVTSESLYKSLPDSVKVFWTFYISNVDISSTQFIWSHNVDNLSWVLTCAKLICQDTWISDNIDHFLSDIKPLPHRLEVIKKIDWVTLIDDGISTSAQSLFAAINAVDGKCVAIVWWYNKWDDYTIITDIVRQKVTCLVCIGSTQDIFVWIAKSASIDHILADSLNTAIYGAIDYAKKTTTPYVLFSPWAASFDMFTNVYDRIEKFSAIIDTL